METKTNAEVVEVYKRYLTSLRDKNANIAENFKAIQKWMDDNCGDQGLKRVLTTDSIYQVLKELRARELKCKDQSHGNWDSDAVQETYKLLSKMDNALKDVSEGSGSQNKLVQLTSMFWKLWNACEDMPWLQLYMLQCYSDRNVGKGLRGHNCKEHQLAKKLLEDPDYQIPEDTMMQGDPMLDNDRTLVEPVYQLWELYQRYDPKDLMETMDCKDDLDGLYKDGHISTDNYETCKDVYLLARENFYLGGGKWSPPKNIKIQNILVAEEVESDN